MPSILGIRASSMTTGAAPPATTAPAVYHVATSNISDLATYTFAGSAIGTASATRRVVVMLAWAAASALTISSATIGGVTATVDSTIAYASNRAMAFISATVPTGTTADVVVNLSGTAVRMIAGVYTLGNGAPTATTFSSQQISGTISVSTQAGDVVLCATLGSNNGGTTTTWTGATEDFDLNADEGSNDITLSGANVSATGATTNVDWLISASGTSRGALAVVYR